MTTASSSPSPAPLPRGRLLRYAALTLILLLAALLRFNHIRQPLIDAFSWRQASTAMMAWNFYHESPNVFFPAVNWAGPEPAYTGREFQLVTFIASLLYRVFGPDDWIGRAIGASAGVWGVFAFYHLVRRVWDEPRALAAALMLALIPGAAFIDRSFLPDPTMLSLTITTAWIYVAYLQTGRRALLALAGAVGVVAFLTKLPGIVTLAPLAYATWAIRRRQDGRPSLKPILLTIAIAVVPIAAYYAWAVYLGTHYPPYHVAGSSNWVFRHGVGDWISRGYYVRPVFNEFLHFLWTPPVMALAALGVLYSPRPSRAAAVEPGDEPPVVAAPWFFHFWAVGCGVLFLLGARELDENPWNLHVFNPVGAAFAGHALVLVARGGAAYRWRVGAAVRTAVIVAVLLLYGHRTLNSLYRSSARDTWLMGRALERVSREGETVVTIAADVGDPIGIYYSRRRGWVFPPANRQDVWRPWNLFPPDDTLSIEMFEQLRHDGADWLGITTRPLDDTPGKREFWVHHPDVVAHINATCDFVEKTPHYVLYRIRPPEELQRR